MPLSKFLQCSAIAIAAVILIQPSEASNEEWETVTSRRQQKVNKKPEAAPLEKPAVTKKKRKNVKKVRSTQPTPVLYIQKPIPAISTQQVKLDERWELTKAQELEMVRRFGSADLDSCAPALLDALRHKVSEQKIKLCFQDFMAIMIHFPYENKDRLVTAFLNIYSYVSNKRTEELDRCLGMSTLIRLLNEGQGKRAEAILKEAMSGPFTEILGSALDTYRSLSELYRKKALTIVAKRRTFKPLAGKNFTNAFNKLFTYFDESTATRVLDSIPTVAQRFDLDKLGLEKCQDRELAWRFLIQSQNLKLKEDEFSRIYKQTYNARSQRYGYYYVDKNDDYTTLFMELLKFFHTENVDSDNSDIYLFATNAFSTSSETSIAILKFLQENRAIWDIYKECKFLGDGAPKVKRYRTFIISDMFVMLRELYESFHLDQEHLTRALKATIPSLETGTNFSRLKNWVKKFDRLDQSIRTKLGPALLDEFCEEAKKNTTHYSLQTSISDCMRLFNQEDQVAVFYFIRDISRQFNISMESFASSLDNTLRNMRQPKTELVKLFPVFMEHCSKLKEKESKSNLLDSAFYNFCQFHGILPDETFLSQIFPSFFGTRLDPTYLFNWFNLQSAPQQEAIYAFWMNELAKEEQNEKFAELILKTGRCLPEALQELIPVAAHVKRAEYMKRMQSKDGKIAKYAATTVIEQYREFGILDKDQDNDELFQYAIMIYVKTQTINDPKNPWAVVAKHRDLADTPAETSVIQSPRFIEKASGISYYVTADLFTGIRVNDIYVEDLPKHSKTYLRDMNKSLSINCSSQTSSVLLNGMYGGYLENLLSFKGKAREIVPVLSAKLIAIVAYLESLPNKRPGPDVNSEQESMFLTFMMHASECETNKAEVIQKFYLGIPDQFKLKGAMSAETTAEIFLREQLAAPLLKMVEEVTACQCKYMKTILGLGPSESTVNGCHIELYVKNMLHAVIPFNRKVLIDRNTYCLPSTVLEFKRQALLEVLFGQFINPEEIAQVVHQMINKSLNTPNSGMLIRLGEYYKSRNFDTELDYDDETKVTSISFSKTCELLWLLGLFKQELKG